MNNNGLGDSETGPVRPDGTTRFGGASPSTSSLWPPLVRKYSRCSNSVAALRLRRPQKRVAHEALEPRTLLAAELIISEIAADNHGDLTTRIRSSVEEDFEGLSLKPDWLELYNTSEQLLSLEDMHLTDDPADLRKWSFPAGTSIDAGEFLVVFASGADLHSQELDERGYPHTNFRLSANGEFLALTDNDGNVIYQYAPSFPANAGSTFGIVMRSETLVSAQTPLEYLIPFDNSHQPSWRGVDFEDPRLIRSDPSNSRDWLVGPTGYQREDISVEGETVGPPVVERVRSEGISGGIYVMESHPFTVVGFVDRWSMYSVNENTVTPLIVNEAFEITGVGKARVSDASGLQEFSFDLQDGSADVQAGYFLAFWDGGNGSSNRGAIHRTSNDGDTVRRFGSGHTHVSAGQALLGGAARARTFSLQASTRQKVNLSVNTNVETAMFQEATSLYVRYPFRVDAPLEVITSLSLQVKYDDALVVYLNGAEVARRNYTGQPRYDGTSTKDRSAEEFYQLEEINLVGHVHELVTGINVLAFHVFNDKADSPELVLDPHLNSVIVADYNATGELFQATPGFANGKLTKGGIDDVTFSVERGFYDSPFQLSLSTPDTPDTTIYFTDDGTLPSPSNPAASIYGDPIDISGTTVIRAGAFQEGFQPSSSVAHTYFFLKDVVQQPDLSPVITEDEVWGPQLIDSLRTLPTISLTAGQEISEDESEVSVEMIFPDGQDGFQINAGVEEFGGHSLHNFVKNSMRLSFKDIYGPSTLAFDLFQQPGSAVEFNQLVLRSGSHDTMNWGGPPGGGRGAYIRSRWAFERQLEMGHLAPLGRFVHVYINGDYWGQYNLMERPNASFMESYAGESPEGYDALNKGAAVDGDTIAWDALGKSIDEGFTQVSQYLDVQNYVDYMLLQFYGGNDWDWNHMQNWMAARQRSFGAGYQFFAWDSDVILRTPISATVINRGGPSDLWNLNGGLKQFPEIQELMAERAALFLNDGGMFTPERLQHDIDALASEIRLSIIAETARWGSANYTPQDWQEAVDWIKDTYAAEDGWTRTDAVVRQLTEAGLFRLAGRPRFWIDSQETTGGFVEHNKPLTMSSEVGHIYYTRDGTDPMQSAPTFMFEPLLDQAPLARVHVPADGNLDNQWTSVDFDDSAWLEGFGSVGFDSRAKFEVGLDIESQMRRNNATAYVRFPFNVDKLAAQEVLKLDVMYDAGFVAHLNGIEVARGNAPRNVSWDSPSVLGRPTGDEQTWEEYDISDSLHLLQPGKNVLAIQLNNETRGNSDALILPRLRLGTLADTGASTQAIRYDGPIDDIRDQRILARVLYRDSWSVPADASFSSRAVPILISEIMYHPPVPTDAEIAAGFDDADDFDFLEIANVSSTPIDLGNVQLVQLDIDNEVEGVAFDFAEANRQTLTPGQRLVVVEDVDAFRFRYGDIAAAGQWSGGLSNRGETLALAVGGTIIQQVHYDDGWYPATDGAGFSLDLVNTSPDVSDWSRAEIWQPSSIHGGTPGAVTAMRADFNFNGSVDVQDIDLLMEAIASANAPSRYDLNEDNVISRLDLEELVLGLLDTQFGDSDLDGSVDYDDFTRLAQNFGQPVGGWAQGDFDGDGKVGFSDFNLLSRGFTG